MIHRASRKRLALALRRYVARRITNDELDAVSVDWRDRGAVAVRQMAWRLYDDLRTHRCSGRHALTREGRRTVARWITFLHSDAEYLWPEYNFVQVSPWIASVLTLGWYGRRHARRWREFLAAGDFDAWPFIDEKEATEAAGRPVLLAGKAVHASVA
jgi:hypothetical protein